MTIAKFDVIVIGRVVLDGFNLYLSSLACIGRAEFVKISPLWNENKQLNQSHKSLL